MMKVILCVVSIIILSIDARSEISADLAFFHVAELQKRGAWRQANEILAEIIVDDPDNVRAMAMMAKNHAFAGDTSSAVASIDAVRAKLVTRPAAETAEAALVITVAFLEMGEIGEARATVDSALALATGDMFLRLRLALTKVDVLIAAEDFASARLLLGEIRDPLSELDDEQMRDFLALLHIEKSASVETAAGLPGRAIEYLTAILVAAQEPFMRADALFRIAEQLTLLGRRVEAVELFSKAVSLYEAALGSSHPQTRTANVALEKARRDAAVHRD